MYKRSMENCCTHAWSSRGDVHTSPHWRPCWPQATIILSYHAPPLAALLKTYNGGHNYLTDTPSNNQSRGQLNSKISMPSPMQALASGLPSRSATDGVPGVSYQDGRPLMGRRTLGGWRHSGSNSSSERFYRLEAQATTSEYMETTKVWSMDGTMGAAATGQSTSSSDTSTTFLMSLGIALQYIQCMPKVSLTLLMPLPEEATPLSGGPLLS